MKIYDTRTVRFQQERDKKRGNLCLYITCGLIFLTSVFSSVFAYSRGYNHGIRDRQRVVKPIRGRLETIDFQLKKVDFHLPYSDPGIYIREVDIQKKEWAI